MKVLAIALARYIGIVETVELDPFGKIFYPPLVAAIAERYAFQNVPKTYAEMDEAKGIVFNDGYWEGVAIQKLSILAGGIVIETRSSTQDSEKIAKDGLEWLASEHGLNYKEGMIKREGHMSQVIFQTNTRILAHLNPALTALSEKMSSNLGSLAGTKSSFETTQILIHIDTLTRKYPSAGFTIQRRIEVPFEDGKYFSEAPIPTAVHIGILEQFEADIIAQASRKK